MGAALGVGHDVRDEGVVARLAGDELDEPTLCRGQRQHLAPADPTAAASRLGFSPQVEPDAVLLRTCPLLDAARRHPEVVCQVHLGLVDGALAAHEVTAPGARLEPFARPGACVLTLSSAG